MISDTFSAPMASEWFICRRREIGIALIAAPADWPSSAWPALIVIFTLPLLIQLRIHETDRLMIYGTHQGEIAEIGGREDMTLASHSQLSFRITRAVSDARRYADQHRDVFDLYDDLRLIQSVHREITGMDRHPEVQMDWPELLTNPIEALCRPAGVQPDIYISVDELVGPDRNLARWVLDDLVGNSVKAGARRVCVALSLDDDGQTLRVNVIDDAPPFPPGTWNCGRGGINRLRSRLRDAGGDLVLTSQDGPGKTVTATWMQRFVR